MKLERLVKLTAAAVAAAALSGCGPDVEKAAIPAVENVFGAQGAIVKCSKIANIRESGVPGVYTGKALVRQSGRKSYYDVKIEMAGEDALVFVDPASRYDVN